MCCILYLFITILFSTPRRRNTRRFCGVWPWGLPWPCTVVWRRQTLWLTVSVWTRTPSYGGPECSPSPWRTADREATKPSVNSCTWRWVSLCICSKVFFCIAVYGSKWCTFWKLLWIMIFLCDFNWSYCFILIWNAPGTLFSEKDFF